MKVGVFCVALLLAAASAQCPSDCTECLKCIMVNSTDDDCAGCSACADLGCALKTTDYTDGFGIKLFGAECEHYAADFYGDLHCKSEAVSAGLSSCYAEPLGAQYGTCTETDYTAELYDCAGDVATSQVGACIVDLYTTTSYYAIEAYNDEWFASCQDKALEDQESACNDLGLDEQTVDCKSAATLADKKASILEYAGIFSKIVQEAQAYACGNSGATYSPTVKTTTPTVYTTSPTVRSKTPTVRSKAPVTTKTPTVRSKTPTIRTGVPTVRSKTPTIRTRAPTRTPTVKTSIPVSGAPTTTTSAPSRSPTVWTRSPTTRTTIPTDTPITSTPTGTPTTVSPTVVTGTPVTISPTGTPVTGAPVTRGPTLQSGTGIPVTSTPVTISPTSTPVTSTPVTISPTSTPVTKSPTGSPTTTTTAPTGTPVTATPTGTPVTKSPTGSPTGIPTGIPTTRTTSPTIDTKTPTTRTKTPVTRDPTGTPVTSIPTTRTKIPVTTTSIPTTRTKIPTVRSKTPTVRSKTPTIRSKTPTVRSSSPTIRSKIPTVRSKTPTARTRTPTIIPTGAPTSTTTAPTGAPTSACVGLSKTCEAEFLSMFDGTSSVLSTTKTWERLNNSSCTNSSINLLTPFYTAVYQCYLTPDECGAGTINAVEYAVTAKRVLDAADSCNLDWTQASCSATGAAGHLRCATFDSICQSCLDERTYLPFDETNMCCCNDATIATAITCNATKNECDDNIATANSKCTAVTVDADAKCLATTTACKAESHSVYEDYAQQPTTWSCDADTLADTYAANMDLQYCVSGQYEECATTRLMAEAVACYEYGPSCAAQLLSQLNGEVADTANCTADSLTAADMCVDMAFECLYTDQASCLLASSVKSVSFCGGVYQSCGQFQTTDEGCTNETIASLDVCNTNAEECLDEIFFDSSFEFGNDVTTMTKCNAAAQMGLDKNSACRQKLGACTANINSDFTIQSSKGLCEELGINTFTGEAYLEGTTDYPTWKIWVDSVCEPDTDRTAAPTSEPVTLAKVSRATAFSTTEQATACDAIGKAALTLLRLPTASSLSCSQEQEEVTTRRRLLNTTTTYSVVGKISAALAASSKEVLAELGVDAFSGAISSELMNLDADLADTAAVSVTPLTTNAPTKMPTEMPTAGAPTIAPAPTVAAPTTDGGDEFSSSSRVAPTLIAAASFLLLLL